MATATEPAREVRIEDLRRGDLFEIITVGGHTPTLLFRGAEPWPQHGGFWLLYEHPDHPQDEPFSVFVTDAAIAFLYVGHRGQHRGECAHEYLVFDEGNYVQMYGWETQPGWYCLDCGSTHPDCGSTHPDCGLPTIGSDGPSDSQRRYIQDVPDRSET